MWAGGDLEAAGERHGDEACGGVLGELLRRPLRVRVPLAHDLRTPCSLGALVRATASEGLGDRCMRNGRVGRGGVGGLVSVQDVDLARDVVAGLAEVNEVLELGLEGAAPQVLGAHHNHVGLRLLDEELQLLLLLGLPRPRASSNTPPCHSDLARPRPPLLTGKGGRRASRLGGGGAARREAGARIRADTITAPQHMTSN